MLRPVTRPRNSPRVDTVRSNSVESADLPGEMTIVVSPIKRPKQKKQGEEEGGAGRRRRNGKKTGEKRKGRKNERNRGKRGKERGRRARQTARSANQPLVFRSRVVRVCTRLHVPVCIYTHTHTCVYIYIRIHIYRARCVRSGARAPVHVCSHIPAQSSPIKFYWNSRKCQYRPGGSIHCVEIMRGCARGKRTA